MKTVYLLDTCIISEPVKPLPNETILAKLEKYDGLCAIPSLVWHELRYGVDRLPEGKRKKRLLIYLQEVIAPFLPVIPYDEHAAWMHANIRIDLEQGKSGSRILPFADGQIAAIALANNLILVTRILKDFKQIRHLAVENWFDDDSTTYQT